MMYQYLRFRPRFSLRTLMVLVALAGIAMGWVGCQLNWIRQRHEFIQNHSGGAMIVFAFPKAPASLRPFGENGASAILAVPPEFVNEGRALFPEAIINPGPD